MVESKVVLAKGADRAMTRMAMTIRSADNSLVSDPGPLTLRAYLGKREISIPLPGIVSLSSMGVQSNSYDESV